MTADRAAPLILLLAIGCPAKDKTTQPTPAKPAVGAPAPIVKALAETKRYRATTRFHVSDPMALVGMGEATNAPTTGGGLGATSTITATRDGKMRVQTTAQVGQRGTMTMVIDALWDGRWQAIESRFDKGPVAAMGKSGRLKFDQSLAPAERRFDTGYNLSGTGLLPGQDLAGTLSAYLGAYTFTPRSRGVYEGRANVSALVGVMLLDAHVAGLIAAHKSAQDEMSGVTGFLFITDALAANVAAMQHLRLTVGDDNWPRKLEFGWTGARPSFLLEIETLDLNPEISASIFAAPFVEKAPDMTARLKAEREKWSAALSDAATKTKVLKLAHLRIAEEVSRLTTAGQ